ncbi:Rhodanese-related sulfurtransferase [hydrothermal vent metagenome]|uniref:Rhodanese-related sulfurtransferase n=1 Tax=hydrothermal vent metagenome TaxID=652676 RepID=A0A3B0TQB4_9ZZZZ
MSVENAVLALAGLMVTVSVVLAWFISPMWLILTLFVGLNLLQSAFTGFCPAAMIFKLMGLKSACVTR